MSPLLEFKDVRFGYGNTLPVIRGLTFSVEPASLVWIRGENGSGKSTALKLAARALRPKSGSVESTPSRTLVTADTMFHEQLTVQEEVAYLASLSLGASHRYRGALDEWGFDASLLSTAISDLSSGWRQRLALGLASSTRSSLILLDEPFVNLDADGLGLIANWVVHTLDGGGAAVIVHHGEPPCLGEVFADTIALTRWRSRDHS